MGECQTSEHADVGRDDRCRTGEWGAFGAATAEGRRLPFTRNGVVGRTDGTKSAERATSADLAPTGVGSLANHLAGARPDPYGALVLFP